MRKDFGFCMIAGGFLGVAVATDILCDTDHQELFKEEKRWRDRRAIISGLNNESNLDFLGENPPDYDYQFRAELIVSRPWKYYVPNGTGDEASIDNYSVGRCRSHQSLSNAVYNFNAQEEFEERLAEAIEHIESRTFMVFERVYSADDVGQTGFIIGNLPGLQNEQSRIPANLSEYHYYPDYCYIKCYVSHIGAWPQRKLDGAIYDPAIHKFIHAGKCYNNTGSIIHEIGHKAGFYHEQTRNDRDLFLSVTSNDDLMNNWGSQWRHRTVERQKFANDGHMRQVGSFDLCSNQMYPVKPQCLSFDENNPRNCTQYRTDVWEHDAINLTEVGYQSLFECMQNNTDLFSDEILNACNSTEEIRKAYTTPLDTDCPANVNWQRNGLTKSDVDAYNLMYPNLDIAENSTSPTPTPPPTPPPTPAPNPGNVTRTAVAPNYETADNDSSDTDLVIILPSVGGAVFVLGGFIAYFQFWKPPTTNFSLLEHF